MKTYRTVITKKNACLLALCVPLFIPELILAATDAVRMEGGDLKVDGIHFSADNNVIRRLSDLSSPWTVLNSNIYFGTGAENVGIGTMTPSTKLEVNGAVKGSRFEAGIFGTTDATQVELRTNSKPVYRASLGSYTIPYSVYTINGVPNIIGGLDLNSIVTDIAGATIAGGGGYSDNFVAEPNSVKGNYGTVSGGSNNSAGSVGWYAGWHATVGGGHSNTAVASGATVGGGRGNTASAGDSTVGGGLNNTAGNIYTVVGGGSTNTASGQFAMSPGGQNNTAGGDYSFAGGRRAKVRDKTAAGANQAFGDQGTFIWADATDADFQSSGSNQFLVRAAGGVGINTSTPAAGSSLHVNGTAVLSGNLGIGTTTPNRRLHIAQNTAAEMSLEVADGLANWKTWNLLAGGGAGVAQNLTFRLLNDAGTASSRDVLQLYNTGNVTVPGSNNWDLNSTEGDFRIGNGTIRLKIGVPVAGNGAGDVAIKADGGMSHLSLIAAGGTGIYSNTTRTAGVTLAAGGSSWAAVSDRNMKQDIEEINTTDVLTKLATLPVYTWRYKTEISGARHAGPMAQDFYTAFGLGNSDRTITTVDADGIALAAIKALKAENDALKADNATMKLRLERLEKALLGL